MSAAVSPIAVVVPEFAFDGTGPAFPGLFGADFGVVVSTVPGMPVGRGKEY